LALPTAAVASEPAIDASNLNSIKDISTGLTPVKIARFNQYIKVPTVSMTDYPSESEVYLKLRVNKRGHTTDARIITSDDPFLNRPVLALVRRMHWDPARLDHHAVSDRVDLTVLVNQ
jgi:outer membrane biosynthesis protein TonB